MCSSGSSLLQFTREDKHHSTAVSPEGGNAGSNTGVSYSVFGSAASLLR